MLFFNCSFLLEFFSSLFTLYLSNVAGPCDFHNLLIFLGVSLSIWQLRHSSSPPITTLMSHNPKPFSLVPDHLRDANLIVNSYLGSPPWVSQKSSSFFSSEEDNDIILSNCFLLPSQQRLSHLLLRCQCLAIHPAIAKPSGVLAQMTPHHHHHHLWLLSSLHLPYYIQSHSLRLFLTFSCGC